MSKLALFLAVPAVAGLAAWNVVLSNEISELRDSRGPADAKPAAAPSAQKGSDDRPAREIQRAAPNLTEVLERLAKLEAGTSGGPAAAAPGSPGGDGSGAAAAEAPIPDEYRSESFTRALDQWYEARMDAQRQKRMTTQAEAAAKFFLRDVPDVTDAQRQSILSGLLGALHEQDAVRQDDDLSDEDRKSRMTAVDQMRREAFANALSPAQLQIVEPRLAARIRRGDATTEANTMRDRVRERAQQGRKNQNGQSGNE
ncbi:MAG: hypothetical protein HMLKMBBP_03358 [Planctomycetes bacterium]|nr:hypothetical protein [Planctomycetota bacterium]